MSDSKQTIGFIGLGLMGSRMAGRLLQAGYPLTVYNRTRAAAEPLAARGAKIAASARELAEQVDVTMISVTDDAAFRAVMTGPDGVLAGLEPESVVIDLSTVSPRITRVLAAEVTARGASMLDATVSGTTVPAEQGTLIIMVGGDRETSDRSLPILDVLGKDVFYLGASGAGATMKLVVNAMLGTGLQALAEAIALGLKAGLEKNRFLDVLGAMPVIPPGLKLKLENARSGQYPVAFPLQHMDKDFGLIAELASECLAPMPATALAAQMSTAERARGRDEDFSAVIRLMLELAGAE